MPKLIHPAAVVLAVFALSGCTLYPASSEPASNQLNAPVVEAPAAPVPDPVPDVVPEPTEFAAPVKSPHFVSSTPAHASILEEAPTEIVLRFNFDVVAPSEIHVSLNADDTPSSLVDFAVGAPVFAADRLSMTQALDPDLLPGLYTVSYVACWPDTSCHEGSFQFQYGLLL